MDSGIASQCLLYAEDRKICVEEKNIEPELVDKNSSKQLVMNPDSLEGWKY